MTKVFVISKDEISLSGCESFSYQTRKVALDNETIHHESIPTILITDYDQKNETNQEESDNENKSVIVRIDNFVFEGNNNSTNNSVNGNREDSLEREEHSNERKSRKRTEAFKSIVLDKPKVFAWETLAYSTIGTAFIGVLVTTPLTVIPAHDIIHFPEYWYEIFFHGAIGITSEIIRMSFVFGNTISLPRLCSSGVTCSGTIICSPLFFSPGVICSGTIICSPVSCSPGVFSFGTRLLHEPKISSTPHTFPCRYVL